MAISQLDMGQTKLEQLLLCRYLTWLSSSTRVTKVLPQQTWLSEIAVTPSDLSWEPLH